MRLLLDTHAFLWWVSDSPRLSTKSRSTIADPANECLVSLASCWEMAIKLSLGKLVISTPFERFIPEQMAANGFMPLEIASGTSAGSRRWNSTIATPSTACW